MAERKRLYSAMQPSGEMHLGRYEGALRNWVRLQDDCDPVVSWDPMAFRSRN